MKRLLIDELMKWKESPRRKPLIVKGIRQVGKTWLLREFGRLAYEDVAYFNLRTTEHCLSVFNRTLIQKGSLPSWA